MTGTEILLWINRYIVGCKYGKDYSADEHTPGINRYIVGCK